MKKKENSIWGKTVTNIDISTKEVRLGKGALHRGLI